MKALILTLQFYFAASYVTPYSGYTRHTNTKRLFSLFASQSSSSNTFPEALETNGPNTRKQRVESPIPSHRSIHKIEKFTRLPVWPAWNGVLLFFLSKFLSKDIIANLEDQFGGRVCPNFFSDPMATSPFIMLVHHVHSFAAFDPLRFIQKSFFPEGFPAHPHRGFITLTYCLEGGMIHRDSVGCLQAFGAEPRHDGKIAQWLSAGAGILHEEMWDIDQSRLNQKQELFQLWINLPQKQKMTKPSICLIGNKKSEDAKVTENCACAPTVYSESGNIETIVLVGEYNGRFSNVETASPMSILHVRMKPPSNNTNANSYTWKIKIPEFYQTAIIYMRTGSVSVISGSRGADEVEEIPAHYTATFTAVGNVVELKCDEKNGADFIFLAGEPIQEVVEARGSMVMTTPDEIEVAYSDYGRGLMGQPWDHRLNDKEWIDHITKFPSAYK